MGLFYIMCFPFSLLPFSGSPSCDSSSSKSLPLPLSCHGLLPLLSLVELLVELLVLAVPPLPLVFRRFVRAATCSCQGHWSAQSKSFLSRLHPLGRCPCCICISLGQLGRVHMQLVEQCMLGLESYSKYGCC